MVLYLHKYRKGELTELARLYDACTEAQKRALVGLAEAHAMAQGVSCPGPVRVRILGKLACYSYEDDALYQAISTAWRGQGAQENIVNDNWYRGGSKA